MATGSRKPSFLTNGGAGSGGGGSTFLPGATARVFGATVLDQEREELEKAQLNAITKCLSLEEAASKEKHVRTLIIGTFKVGGPHVFWQKVKDHVPLHSNDVVTWKFLIVFHRLMQDGHSSVPKDSRPYCGFIDEIVNSHKQSKSAYGKLSYSYGGLIISRLLFHAKYPNIPGSLTVKDQSIVRNDAANNFELAIDFLDLLERIIKVKKVTLSTFDPGKSHSSTASGQCRLSSLVPCINDSARIFDLLSKTIKILHVALPWDTLSGHRKRFRLQYTALEELYVKLDHFHYLKSTVNIPKLSGKLEEFMAGLHRMPDDPVPPDHREAADDVDDSRTAATTVEQFEQNLITVDDPLNASLAYVQQEYSDLSVKYQNVIHMLSDERGGREAAEQEASLREHKLKLEVESFKQQNYEMVVKHRESLEAAAIASATEANEEKLGKLKAAYQKLRSDHIVLLRQKAEVEKIAKSQMNFLEVEELLKGTSMEGKTVSSQSEMLGLLRQVLDDRTAAEKDSKEKLALINQLQNEKRLLDLECGEKNLVMKEELEELKRREVPRLREKVEELRLARDRLEEENAKKSAELAEAKEVESAWREKLSTHLASVCRRLAAPGTTPTRESIFAVEALNCCDKPTAASRLGTKQDVIFHVVFALMQLQPFEKDDDLGDLARVAGDLLHAVEGDVDDPSSSWEQFVRGVSIKLGSVRGMSDFDPASEVDREIFEMQESIDQAARAMEKLMREAKADESKPNLDVDLKIIDSCSQLLVAVQEMIKSARRLQGEITEQGRREGSSSSSSKPSAVTAAKDLYKRNQKWSEGLISAAKDIGGGAKLLVDSANDVIHGDGKFEELIAASQEIAGSTAQLVIASKVKARQDSAKLTELKTTSKSVAESTAQVIATCRTCSAENQQDANVDLTALSVHQSKRLEMEIQIKVLQLETELERQRKQLFDLRKLQYANSNPTSTTTENGE